MFEIVFSNKSARFTKNCERHDAKRILEKIESLKENPVIHDTKVLSGKGLFRIRIGRYRVLYSVKNKEKIILIDNIDKRERVYN